MSGAFIFSKKCVLAWFEHYFACCLSLETGQPPSAPLWIRKTLYCLYQSGQLGLGPGRRGDKKAAHWEGPLGVSFTLIAALQKARNPGNSGCGNLRRDTRGHDAAITNTHTIPHTKTARIWCVDNHCLRHWLIKDEQIIGTNPNYDSFHGHKYHLLLQAMLRVGRAFRSVLSGKKLWSEGMSAPSWRRKIFQDEIQRSCAWQKAFAAVFWKLIINNFVFKSWTAWFGCTGFEYFLILNVYLLRS